MEEKIIPKSISSAHKIAPRCEVINGIVHIRSISEIGAEIKSKLEFILGGYIVINLIEGDEFNKEYNEVFSKLDSAKSGGIRFKVLDKTDDLNSIKREIDSAPIVKLVDDLISRAIKLGASDVHFDPGENKLSVRYRLDGKLHEVDRISLDKRPAITSRIKVMADLDIAERRRPQDGRIRVTADGRTIDLRTSIIPTDFGEKVAIRILDKSQLKLNLDNLGMSNDQLGTFKEAVKSPNGIILVTGPTGSGKTTTLYAALNYIKSPDINIMTIEDPIEYNLEDINQSQVKRAIGYDFASALRTFLRQDPDVILVGEIRDRETAEIAIRASLTGHLVLSTLHTNDAASAITRLVDIGIEPYLVASSLRLVMAQRLIRLLCPSCKIKAGIDYVSNIKEVDLDPDNIFAPSGCPNCFETGYTGRIGVFELLPINSQISELIHGRIPTSKISELSRANGIISLKDSVIEKIRSGISSINELNNI